jgi:hypothetical protein
MAPTFYHGKGTKILANQFSLSSAMNDVSYDHTVETADVTTFTDNDREYIVGQRTGSMSMSGFHDGSTEQLDRQLQNLAGGSSAAVFTVGVGGDSTGAPAALINGHINSYSVTSPAGDVVGASVGVQFSSQMHTGAWLAPLAARATATTHAAVGYLPSTQSTRGGIGHLHVTAATTSGTATVELSMNIQDSSDGATWGDLINFTDIDSTNPVGHERVKVTGQVHENLRAAADVQGSTSITYAVAFARL